MACSKCSHQGYVETFILRDNVMRPVIEQCRACNDVAAYSRKVQEMLGSQIPKPERKPAEVILLRKRADP